MSLLPVSQQPLLLIFLLSQFLNPHWFFCSQSSRFILPLGWPSSSEGNTCSRPRPLGLLICLGIWNKLVLLQVQVMGKRHHTSQKEEQSCTLTLGEHSATDTLHENISCLGLKGSGLPGGREGLGGAQHGTGAGSRPSAQPPAPPEPPQGAAAGSQRQAHSQHCAPSSTLSPTKNPEASGVYTNHKPLSGSCIYKLRHVEIKGDTTWHNSH